MWAERVRRAWVFRRVTIAAWSVVCAALVVGVAAAPPQQQQQQQALGLARAMPAELARLAATARLGEPIAAWCRAEFRAGQTGAYAVALASAAGARYVALDTDGRVTELGAFRGTADLSCYSRERAEELDASIRESETIHGQITPRWNTTVVCGFVEETVAECWQYSPATRTFVAVGRWMT